jgi:hypothetical protein
MMGTDSVPVLLSKKDPRLGRKNNNSQLHWAFAEPDGTLV